MREHPEEETWLKVREALRLLRGQNLFRGREMHLPLQKLVVIPTELRGEGGQDSGILLHLTQDEHELWAEERPSGEKFHIRDHGVDVGAFVAALVARARGGNYLRTNSEKGTYREGL
jgi:hypothetical protein